MSRLIYHDSDGVDKTLQLGTDPVVVGRASDCQIQTHDAMVSRKHARITYEGNYFIEDLGSSNGVFLGADKVTRAAFRPGDIVTCGSLVIRMMPDVRRSGVEIDSIVPTKLRAPPPLAEPMPIGEPPAPVEEVHPRMDRDAPRPRQPTPAPRAQPASSSSSSAAALPPSDAELQRARAELRREVERRERAEAALLVAEEKVHGIDAAGKEIVKLRQRIDQLESELSEHTPTEPPVSGPPIDLAELAEAVAVFNDALAELKASLRAAVDESELLTAPAASVRIVRDSMQQATDELERARLRLREMTANLGLRRS